MDPYEIQARAAIAAALIQQSNHSFDIRLLANSSDATTEQDVADLRVAVDRIYAAITKHKVP
jgi:hypothetical protein